MCIALQMLVQAHIFDMSVEAHHLLSTEPWVLHCLGHHSRMLLRFHIHSGEVCCHV